MISCREDSWEVVSTNKFLSENSIDTADYKTFDELSLKKELSKIVIPDTTGNGKHLHFDEPEVSLDGCVFIEKILPNSKKNIIVKYDYEGKPADSILINKNAEIINDYIIENDFYISWFIDGDKKMKKVTNELKSNNENTHQFSNNFTEIDLRNSEGLVKVDNFFAKTHEKLIKGNKLKKIHYPTPSSLEAEQCEVFRGTYFITMLKQPYLKVKIFNQTVCDDADKDYFSCNYRFYTEDFLNFYMIDKGFNNTGNRVFYIFQK